MAKRADNSGTLSEAQICEINGISQSRRQTWVSRGLVRAAPEKGCELVDALELASLALLAERLSPQDLPVIWEQLQPKLRQIVAGTRADLVVDVRLKTAALARNDSELRPLVAHGRPTVVLDLSEALGPVADTYRRVARHRSSGASRRSATSRARRQASS